MAETTEPDEVHVSVERIAAGRLLASSAAGAQIEFGAGGFSPAELLLAALAGCMISTVEEPAGRGGGLESLRIDASALAVQSADGENVLDDVQLSAQAVLGPDPDTGRRSAAVHRLLELAHERYCTVSRTLEHEVPVQLDSTVTAGSAAEDSHGDTGSHAEHSDAQHKAGD